MKDKNGLEVIKGAKFSDDRGTLIYFNEFDLKPIKRFYIINHPHNQVVRAWQGHQIEQKWFHVIAGSFKIILVRIDTWQKPSDNLRYEEFNLTAEENCVLHVCGGYASGIRANIENSKMIVFSDQTLEESIKDDYRFDKGFWYKW